MKYYITKNNLVCSYFEPNQTIYEEFSTIDKALKQFASSPATYVNWKLLFSIKFARHLSRLNSDLEIKIYQYEI